MTVAMPNYNHGRFLVEALESVLDQSYRPIEIIVIDDASTDDSARIIEGLASRHPEIRFYRNETNKGVVFTLNRILEYASGEYVCPLACDDLALPGLLEKSADMLNRFPGAGACQSLHHMIGENGENRGIGHSGVLPYPTDSPPFLGPQAVRATLKKTGDFFVGFNVYRRSALLEVGGFVPEMHEFTDLFAFLAIALKHGVCFVREPLHAWRLMDSSFSVKSNKVVKNKRDLYQHSRAYLTSFGDSFPPEFVTYFQNGAFRQYARALRAEVVDFASERIDELHRNNEASNLLQKMVYGVMRVALSCLKILLFLYTMSGHLSFNDARLRFNSFVRRLTERRIGVDEVVRPLQPSS
jgi:glycosyltransferase involved in cell wall biosynthesis